MNGDHGRALVCFFPSEENKIERFLAHVDSSEPRSRICMLTIGSRLSTAKMLKTAFSRLEIHIVEYPACGVDGYYSPSHIAEELKDSVKSMAPSEGIVFLTGAPTPIRYMPGMLSLPFKQNYNHFRILKLLGIDRIAVFESNSLIPVSVPYLLDDFVDIHRGKRCFVVGNGPSLGQIDMSRLRDEITLGSNRVYLGFEEWGYRFQYWCIVDSLQIEKYMREWEAHIPEEMVKFFPFENLNLFNMKNYCPVNFYPPGHPENKTNFNDPLMKEDPSQAPAFSDRPDVVFLGHTVTYAMIQIAVIMGCNPIYLVGVDHRYSTSTIDKVRGLWRDATSSSHFHKGYGVQGDVERDFHLPNIKESERAFDYAAKWARANNVGIYNASPGTALKSFETVSFDAVF